MREFRFEVELCARLEADGALVARQLGAGVRRVGNRVIDVIRVEPGPGFEARAAITPEAIPDIAIEADVGAGRARYWKDAVADLDVSPERARAAVDRAVDVGFFERERRNGRDYVRQAARYPTDWFGRLRAIENKPDLGAPGALERQLRTDVALALVDEVILATASYVTRAHRNRLPDEVGIWRVREANDGDDGDAEDGVSIEVVREPTPLATGEPGIEIVDEAPARTDVRVAGAGEKARKRRRIAERAYGKGWRTYSFPGCSAIAPASVGGAGGLPHCSYHGRIVDPGTECDPACPGHDPADPPDVDLRAERDRRSPWVADPDGRARRQAGLDRFDAGEGIH